MRKIVHFVHTSIDGYIHGPNGEFDWPVLSPELSAYSMSLHDRTDTLLYGRVVWGWMSSYWPTADSTSDHPHDIEYAPVWRRTPKIVVSRTLTEVGHGARLLSDASDLAAVKKEQGGDILLIGGSTLAASLTDLGLLDEYHIVVHPVVLGGGQPLFPAGRDRLNLGLIETKDIDGRCVLLRYGATE
jgi:dihydrofolate reductase